MTHADTYLPEMHLVTCLCGWTDTTADDADADRRYERHLRDEGMA